MHPMLLFSLPSTEPPVEIHVSNRTREESFGEIHENSRKQRAIDLWAVGNGQVNLLALEGVVRLAKCLGTKLEPVVKTLLPAVCKNLASTNQQVTDDGRSGLYVNFAWPRTCDDE